MKKALAWCCCILGILCIILAVVYWTVPAGSLPAYLPGYEAGVAATHFKHGLAAVVIGLLLLIVAWFASAPKRN